MFLTSFGHMTHGPTAHVQTPQTPKLLPRSLAFIETHDPIKSMRMHGHSKMLPRPLTFVAVSLEGNKKHTGNQIVFVEYNLEWMQTPPKLLSDPPHSMDDI